MQQNNKTKEHSSKRFYIVGLRPVKFIPDGNGGLHVLKYNSSTGIFEPGMEYFAKAAMGRDESEAVSEEEFIEYVETRRAQDLHGEGPVFDIYQKISFIFDRAVQERRNYTTEEQKQIRELSMQSHKMFQEQFPDKLA